MVALSTTIAVCAVISIFTFIAGFLCGHYFGRLKESQTPENLPEPPILHDRTPSLDPPIASQPVAVPVYEEVELKENAAYQTFKFTSIEQ